jgi:hypothetical protein
VLGTPGTWPRLAIPNMPNTLIGDGRVIYRARGDVRATAQALLRFQVRQRGQGYRSGSPVPRPIVRSKAMGPPHMQGVRGRPGRRSPMRTRRRRMAPAALLCQRRTIGSDAQPFPDADHCSPRPWPAGRCLGLAPVQFGRRGACRPAGQFGEDRPQRFGGSSAARCVSVPLLCHRRRPDLLRTQLDRSGPPRGRPMSISC